MTSISMFNIFWGHGVGLTCSDFQWELGFLSKSTVSTNSIRAHDSHSPAVFAYLVACLNERDPRWNEPPPPVMQHSRIRDAHCWPVGRVPQPWFLEQ